MFLRFLLSLPAFIGQIFYYAFIIAVVGSMAFFLGQLLPRRNFDYTAYPFKPFGWEQDGKVYTKIKIQFWKDKVPDMSQHIKSMFRKKICVFRNSDYLEELILETCVAEMVHFLLILISPIFLLLMHGVAGVLGMIGYILGNIPFILIQRYNRPRLIQLMQRQRMMSTRRQKASLANA